MQALPRETSRLQLCGRCFVFGRSEWYGRVGSTMSTAAFGLLSYAGTNNLGDEVQSLAALRFLPRVDRLVDRDNLSSFETAERTPVSVILNGWYGHRPENWPPAPCIRPLLVSVHFSPYWA